MTYFDKIMQSTKDAINFYHKKGIRQVDVKSIRSFMDVPSSDRSKINFISRSLNQLAIDGFLEKLENKSTLKYKIRKKTFPPVIFSMRDPTFSHILFTRLAPMASRVSTNM